MEKVYEGVHKMSAAKEYGDRYRELYGLGRPQTVELVSFRFPCSMGVFVARIDSYRMWVGQNGRTGDSGTRRDPGVGFSFFIKLLCPSPRNLTTPRLLTTTSRSTRRSIATVTCTLSVTPPCLLHLAGLSVRGMWVACNDIANGKDTRTRCFAMFACACLGAYCGHCVAITSARERLEKRRWFKYHV